MDDPFVSQLPRTNWFAILTLLTALLPLLGGCTTLTEWVHNGFKVGPQFHRPTGPVAADWIDATDERILPAPMNEGYWWGVFNDATLTSLIDTAYRQNLDLKTAGTRVLQARAQRNITGGNLFPQTQQAIGIYDHAQLSKNFDFVPGGGQGGQGTTGGLPQYLNIWADGFNLSWELDFWGRLRRALESSNADLNASVEAYHDALVTLVADVATNYVQIRTFQQRLVYAHRNVELQKGSLRYVEERLKEGKGTGLDVAQIQSILAQTKATIPPLEIGLRQANNRLCVLLGLPTHNLIACLNEAPIPKAPPEVAVGIPAGLLERRPDVRRALRQAAAQSAQIGIAEADFYPRIGVTGFLGYAASDFRHLFDESSFTGFIIPNFQWKILNYGRVLNNVRGQKANFQERVLQYQQTVLTAGREVEDALVAFLQYQVQARHLVESERAAQRSVDLILEQLKAGRADINRLFNTESQLVNQLDRLAVARGNIAMSLISVYRALGGGWQFFEPGLGTEEPGDKTEPRSSGSEDKLILPAP